jgi:hypothetical protein
MVRLPNGDFTPNYRNSGDGILAAASTTSRPTSRRWISRHSIPEAPPPKAQAFWDIVLHNRPPQEAELADSIDLVKYKGAIPNRDVVTTATGSLAEWLRKTDRHPSANQRNEPQYH